MRQVNPEWFYGWNEEPEPPHPDEYPRPWRIAYHLAWYVVDANGGTVAGSFGSSIAAQRWLDSWPNP